jgi:hypothetical protein
VVFCRTGFGLILWECYGCESESFVTCWAFIGCCVLLISNNHPEGLHSNSTREQLGVFEGYTLSNLFDS